MSIPFFFFFRSTSLEQEEIGIEECWRVDGKPGTFIGIFMHMKLVLLGLQQS